MGDQDDVYVTNGLNDGWLRPPGPAPLPPNEGDSSHYSARSPVSYSCRYWVTWVTAAPLTARRDLHCNFDDLDTALAHVAEREAAGDRSGGIWDRRYNRWAD